MVSPRRNASPARLLRPAADEPLHRRAALRLSAGLPLSRGLRAAPGFTLLEVLVAVIVLSFGVLGVVGLQAASLQANREARLQSSAARLGRELADLMRSNKEIADVNSMGTNPYLVDFNGSVPAAPQDCYATKCTPTTMAQWQMSDWLGRVNDELPGVRVRTCFDTAPYDSGGKGQWTCSNDGPQVVVKIGWMQLSTDRSQQGAGRLQPPTVPTIILPLTPGH